MHIEKNRVVSIDYELKDADGSVIDKSDGESLMYLHGYANIIPGLERELAGKQVGDRIQCAVPPSDAYGERDEELVFAVAKTDFAEPDKIEVGMQFHAHQEGGVGVVTVVGLAGDTVTVDANHPMAGKTLHFDVSVKDIREASAEEIKHGHVHGDEDCGEGCGGSCGCGCSDDCDDDCGSSCSDGCDCDCECGDDDAEDAGCGCGGCH
jgi:FKBP-type peptidyl-prolyl cis-trans isomerase SlyD